MSKLRVRDCGFVDKKKLHLMNIYHNKVLKRYKLKLAIKNDVNLYGVKDGENIH